MGAINHSIDCLHSLCEYIDPMFENDVGVDLCVVGGSRIELFVQKKYLRPINDETALLLVKVLGVHDDIAAIQLPSADILSRRSVVYVPLSRIHSSSQEGATK